MNRDPIDELAARLFDAARHELPPEGAERRALAAAEQMRVNGDALHASRRIRAWCSVGVIALAGAAAATVLTLEHKQAVERIFPEPALSRKAGPIAAPLSAPTPSADASNETVRIPVRPSNVTPAPSLRPAAASLSDELAALKLASTALAAGDSSAALRALDRYDHELKGSKLRAEATLLRIEALARSGDVQAASALAQRFVNENPNSPLVDRARSYVEH